MKIEIDETVLRKYHFNFKKAINHIIDTVPQEHILGLGKIWITDSTFTKEEKNAYGLYYGKREGANIPTIIINIANLFDNIPKFFFYCIPLIPKLFLANTFYHEVAHHYQRLRHGITKQKWEIDAKSYSRKMMLRMFKGHILIIKLVFSPILFLYKNLKRGKKKENA